MASDQYEIPDFSPLREALDAADAARVPEVELGRYQQLEAIGAEVDVRREAAVVEARRGRMWRRATDPFSLNERSPLDAVIDTEGLRAGQAFNLPGARFWMGKRHELDRPGIRHWYFAYESKGQPPIYIHYEVTADSIQKFYNGQLQVLSLDEEERLVDAIGTYLELTYPDAAHSKAA